MKNLREVNISVSKNFKNQIKTNYEWTYDLTEILKKIHMAKDKSLQKCLILYN